MGKLVHTAIKQLPLIAATVAGDAIGGPWGAAAGAGLEKKFIEHKGLGESLLAAGTAGTADYFSGGAGNFIGGGLEKAGGSDLLSGTQVGNLLTKAGGFLTPTPGNTGVGAGGAGGGPDWLPDPNVLSGGQGSDFSGVTAGGAPAAGSAAGAGGGQFDKISGFLSKNADWLKPAAAIGAAGLMGNQKLPGEAAMSQQAGATGAEANKLLGSLSSGTLPVGAQTQIQQGLDAGIAGIKSKYSQMGLSGSTMEQQEIQNARNTATGQTFDVSKMLTDEGIRALGISDEIYQAIAKNALTQDQDLAQAIASLAGSAGAGAAYHPGA